MPKILHRYILTEMWPTFLSSLLVAVFIVLATKMLPITELIVSRGVEPGQVGWMLLYLLPDILIFSLPAASLMATVVAFLRLNADSEIIAMKASGVSLRQMLPPVLVLCTVGLILSMAVAVLAVPWGNRSFKELLFQIAKSKADLGIKANVFSEAFPNVVFFVNRFSPHQGLMEQVFVVDRRDRKVMNTIVAREARIFMDAGQRVITLHFAKGTIFVVERDLRAARTIEFETYDLNIGLEDIVAALASREKAPKELSVRELVKGIREMAKGGGMRRNEMLIELMEKLTIPIAVFFMGLVGFPLGAQIQARGRSVGIGISLVVFMIYYLCLAGVRNICETGVVPPLLAVWIPVVFLAGAFFYLYSRVAREKPLHLLPGFLTKPRGTE